MMLIKSLCEIAAMGCAFLSLPNFPYYLFPKRLVKEKLLKENGKPEPFFDDTANIIIFILFEIVFYILWKHEGYQGGMYALNICITMFAISVVMQFVWAFEFLKKKFLPIALPVLTILFLLCIPTLLTP